MTVVVHLPGALLPFTAGQSQIALEAGPDVGAALRALYALHPGLRDRIQDERGELRRHVNVFLGSDNVRDLAGLGTALTPDAVVHILPAVSGG